MAGSHGASTKTEQKVLVEILEWNDKSSFYGPHDTLREAHIWASDFVSRDLDTQGYKTHWMNFIVKED